MTELTINQQTIELNITEDNTEIQVTSTPITLSIVTGTVINNVTGGSEEAETVTSDTTLNDANANTVYNNTGDNAVTVFTVAAGASIGKRWRLQVGQDTNGIKITAGGSRKIINAGEETSAGGSIQCLQKGGIADIQIGGDNNIWVNFSRRTWYIV